VDFALNEEQREFKDYCRRFAAEVMRPAAPKHDAEESVPWEVIKEARGWGLHGLDHIQRMGTDPDGQLSAIYAEELHWGCAGIALAISASSLAAAGLAASGTPEQIAQWVPQCFGTDDEIKLGAYAVTEAGAGSDVKSLRTTAKLDGDEWVLNGTKVFISNGGIASPPSTPSSAIAARPPSSSPRARPAFVRARRRPRSASAPPTPRR
jgi:acyl-CoA dehydrogenase